ncbi:MAG TPA: hypothetical protein VFN22_05020 [Gemmatimonadales bacterium]|nr:hypothetical protein [Gemmatimonadales bacterium]
MPTSRSTLPACADQSEIPVSSYLDAISAFLVKHPTGDFARGTVVFAPVFPVLLLTLLTILAAGVTITALANLRGMSRRDRMLLGGLRIGAILLAVFCLTRPMLVLTRALPQRNVLAIVYDDSRSMSTPDASGGTRLEAVQRAFGDSSALMTRLRDRFVIREYRLGGDSRPIASTADLQGQASRSDLGAGLAATTDALADQPLAGIVLVSDGAQNGLTPLDAAFDRLSATGIPVHTVGVGTAPFKVDVGIDALSLPTEVLVGSDAPAELTLRTRGVAGQRLVITTEVGARLGSVDTVQVRAGRELIRVPLTIPATEPGDLPVRVQVAPVAGEVTDANNRASGVLRVRAGPEKLLYVEGEPRSELPFLRRAVAPDSALQLVALVRTSEGKYLRLGVDDSLELRNGFPTERAELFRYRAVVLGSVEAGFFSADQLRMLQEFVERRGGGLLALGGRRALAEGGYAGTPVGEALPVELDHDDAGASATRAATRVHVTPTISSLGAPFSLGRERVTGWDSLPDLTVVNHVGALKPGAVTLLDADGATPAARIPVMVTQRFGRGHTTLFLPQDAWRWQMARDLPPDDLTLPALWTRVLRNLVDGVPDRVTLDVAPAVGAPGESRRVQVAVADSIWQPRDDARVTVRVTPPDAASYDLPVPQDLSAVGAFAVEFTPSSTGTWRIEARATLDDTELTTGAIAVVSNDASDPGSMERDDATLAALAERTGGRSYDIERLGSLPDDAALTESGVTARVSDDLWDAPLIFLLFVGLLAADWALRRSRGLG